MLFYYVIMVVVGLIGLYFLVAGKVKITQKLQVEPTTGRILGAILLGGAIVDLVSLLTVNTVYYLSVIAFVTALVIGLGQGTSKPAASVDDPPLARFLFGDVRFSWFWWIVRVYVGWEWLNAGFEKVINPAWVGPNSGTALAGFVKGALAKTTGANPSVQSWYASFLQNVVLPNTSLWSTMVAFGELFVGIGLILGLFTGIAAFFGGLMNVNYLLAGTVSVNPFLFVFATWLVLAWKTAGWLGLDHWVLPLLGVPGRPGKVFTPKESTQPAPIK